MAEGGTEQVGIETGDTRRETPAAVTLEMTDVMSLLMEDRRSRERELREQMEMLRTLVEAGTRREAAPTASGGTISSEDKVKLSKLTETDDIEAYIPNNVRENDGSVRGSGKSLAVQVGTDADGESPASIRSNGASKSC